MNFYDSDTDYDLTDGDFMFAIRLENNDFDPNQIGIYFEAYTWDNDQSQTANISAEVCRTDHFHPSIVDELYRLTVIDNYM